MRGSFFFTRLVTQVLTLCCALWFGEGLSAAEPDAQKTPISVGKVLVRGEPGAVLFMDGQKVGTLPLTQPLPTAAGRHRVRLQYGKHHREGPLEVIANRLLEVQFEATTGAVVMNMVPALLFLPRERFADATSRPHHATLESIVEARRLSLIDEKSALAATAQLSSCMQTLACQLQLAAQHGADYVMIAALVEQRDKQGFRFDFTLIDVEVGEVAKKTTWRCERCSAEDAAANLREPIEQLISDGTARERGALVVRTEPPGAAVRIDDRSVGVTPYEHPMFARELELLVTHRGYREERRRVHIEAGKKQEVELRLVEQRHVVEGRGRRPPWRLGIGSAALAVGALFVGFGAAALAQNDACVAPKQPMAEACRKIYDTNRLGGGLVGVGIPFLAFGALFIAIPQR